MAALINAPRLECDCGENLDLTGRRIGDSLSCGSCGTLRVVIRSRVKGEIPPASSVARVSMEERGEIQEVLQRIKLRRSGRATRHLHFYPSWAVFVSGLQFYLSGILAGQNLIAIGEARRGKRIRLLGVISYFALGALFLTLGIFWGDQIPLSLGAGVLALVPLAFASYFTWAQHRACSAAREAGAGEAPVLLPLLLGLILAIAQAFAVWFLKLQLDASF